MSALEEQTEEMQALEAIFMQDLTIHSTQPPVFDLWILPHTDDAEPNHVALTLHVTLPPQYPTQLPILDITTHKDLDVSQKETLLNIALEEATNNLDTVMIFSIVQVLRDWLLEHNVKKLSAHEQAVQRKNIAKGIDPNAPISQALSDSEEVDDDVMISREKQLVVDTEEEAERKAQHGTPFSVDRFLKWKKHFEKEMREKESKESKENEDPEKANRITGKKFFEMRAALHIVGEEALSSQPTESKSVQWFDESLYADEDLPDD